MLSKPVLSSENPKRTKNGGGFIRTRRRCLYTPASAPQPSAQRLQLALQHILLDRQPAGAMCQQNERTCQQQ